LEKTVAENSDHGPEIKKLAELIKGIKFAILTTVEEDGSLETGLQDALPKGLDDPELALLKVHVKKAEYWDLPGTLVGRAFNFARAYASKDPSKLGDHAKVNLGRVHTNKTFGQ
jgi:hypothetical protein